MLIARRKEILKELNSMYKNHKVKFTPCDLRNPEECRATVEEMRKEDFLPDIVVLNAGIFPDESELDFATFTNSIDTNIKGAYYWILTFMENFTSRGSGQFLAMGSFYSHWPDD